MKNLPEKYAELVAKWPELAVKLEPRPGRECTLAYSVRFPNWEWRCDDGIWGSERDASAALGRYKGKA